MRIVDRKEHRSPSSPFQRMLACIDWTEIQHNVYLIESRIALAEQRKETRKARRLRTMLTQSFSAKALAAKQASFPRKKANWTIPVLHLSEQAEPMASLSLAHLSPTSRRKLASDSLSVYAYPNDYGGFVYVGGIGGDMPEEPDLFHLAEVAQLAKLVWLKFDECAETIDGLPVFEG